jgi:threonine/homoserine/homoserine lactone efflux protein
MVTYLLFGAGYGLAAAAQPGPFQAYVIAQTLAHGWRPVLPVTLAPLLSDGPIVALALLLLSRFPPGWQRGLSVVGGAFALYLAVGTFRAWLAYDAGAVARPRDARQTVFKAALTNLLSPGPYLYWGLVAGPVFLKGWRRAPMYGVGFVAGFYGAMLGCLVALIGLFDRARRLGPRVNRALLALSALMLVAFGGYQVWQGIIGA